MNQPRELLFVALGIVLCSSAASNQLFAQTPCETGKLLDVDLEDGAKFGEAVAIEGDTAIVGASHFDVPFFDPGAAYVFRFDGLDWLLQQKLVSSDGVDSDRFGHSVALDGDTVVVGAVWGAPVINGSAYIFRFDPDTSQWFEQQKLFDPEGGDLDGFGASVAVVGETVFIGSPADNGGSGSTFVYTFDGAIWVLHQVLHPSDGPGLGRRFGKSVAVDGGKVLIGASADNELGTSVGAAYVFRFDPDTSDWIQEQKLLPSDGEPDDRFGTSVSLSGDVAVIGTRLSESAYVFSFDSESWNEQQILVASDPADPSQDFGQSVAISGDMVVVGAGDDDENGMDAGAAFLFRFDGKSWLPEEKLLPGDPEPGDHFGLEVAISGETALIGAPLDDNRGVRIGSAYVFTGLAGIDCNRNGTADGCDIYDGSSVDANGNGVPDECEGGPCPWDLDSNGSVGATDLLSLLVSWGPCEGCPADFDGNGSVGATDLLALLVNWGPCL